MKKDSNSYALPKYSLPGLKPEDHLADLFDIRDFIESLGVSTHNTRIQRYIEYYEKNLNTIQVDASEIFKNVKEDRFRHWTDWHMYILREVHELMWILKGLKICLPNGIKDRIRMIVSGSDFAALDTNTQSRNIQFELRIASYFCQAGCKVDLSLTDVIVITDESVFFIECKRVGSARQLQKSILEAKKQLIKRMPSTLENKRVYGIIAADVTKVAYQHNGLTWAISEEHARDLIQGKLIDIVKETEKLRLFTKDIKLLQCWLQIHIPSLIMHPPSTTTRFSSFGILNPRLDRKSRRANRLVMKITANASTDDERAIPSKKLVPRKSITIPAGALIYFDENLLEEFLEAKEIQFRDYEEIIATLEFEGNKYEFGYFEFCILKENISEVKHKQLASDPEKARIVLVMEMFFIKYPFENTDYEM